MITAIAKQTTRSRGNVAGQYVKFIKGHAPRKPLEQRFWGKVVHGSDAECWLWTGAKNPNGYGHISLGGPENIPEYVHRLSWIIRYGPIPDNMVICHSCDVRLCVNPSHLFLGTQTDNVQDSIQKGRSRRIGSGNPHATLTDEDVKTIRFFYELGGYTYSDLGELFSVHKETIAQIVRRDKWQHIT